MAIRKILTEDEELLHKKSKPVTEFNERLWQLLDDMAETLKQADGVGLAAPQVGVLRRVFIMDLGDGVVEVINPEFVEKKGRQEDVEGCLSCPGEYGITVRPLMSKSRRRTATATSFSLTGRAEGALHLP